jgi:hypothetical protein
MMMSRTKALVIASWTFLSAMENGDFCESNGRHNNGDALHC